MDDSTERAYWHYRDQWKHVYIIERYQQTDIFGTVVEMARVKLTKFSKEMYEVEAEKLTYQKPRKSKVGA